jgi:hypothetical protein
VHTYYVCMNLTLSVDEQTVERARQVAQAQGMSLNELIRKYLERLAGRDSYAEISARLQKLWAEPPDAPRGADDDKPYKFNREDAYDRKRTGRG